MMHHDERQLVLNLYWLMEHDPERYQQALKIIDLSIWGKHRA